jgi:hypothetical protein
VKEDYLVRLPIVGHLVFHFVSDLDLQFLPLVEQLSVLNNFLDDLHRALPLRIVGKRDYYFIGHLLLFLLEQLSFNDLTEHVG